MKPVFVILIIAIVVVTVCVVAGYIMFKQKSADPIPLTAKPKGKIAIVYYSQS